MVPKQRQERKQECPEQRKPDDAYPETLSVQSWVSRVEVITADVGIPEQQAKQLEPDDNYPEVPGLQTRFSHVEVIATSPEALVPAEVAVVPVQEVSVAVIDHRNSVHGVHDRGKPSDTIPVHLLHNVQGVPNVLSLRNKENVNKVIPTLNPEAAQFVMRDPDMVHGGKLAPDLAVDWAQVQRVQAGGEGDPISIEDNAWAQDFVATQKSSRPFSTAEPVLPFQLADDISDLMGIAPKQVTKVNSLQDVLVKIPGKNFIDKALPAPKHQLVPLAGFTPDYFVAMHNIVAAPGIRGDGTMYSKFTPNHLGARVTLPHVKLNVDRWRYHLTGYENIELVQYIEYGFPLGLQSSPELESATRNHGSSYSWYGYVDKFVCKEVSIGGMTGPFKKAPWWNTIVSPLMTAHKKPRSRRTVFDATFGDKSLNNATPTDTYLGQPCQYTFPKIEDYRLMILVAGKGSFMWKKDLSRFFLQLPIDPVEYNKVAIVWRGLLFFFLGLAFGLRHSGLNGQRITDAVSWIHRRLGLECGDGGNFSCCNYVDDIGGVEPTKARAEQSFKKLKELLEDLGLDESKDKSERPTTKITYLGVQFDSQAMTMSVPPEKLTEIKADIRLWLRKTTISKRELQSILGKLFWVAKVVKYSRAFMGRLLAQLRAISGIPDHKKVKLLDESRKDIMWWAEYLEKFNGINLIINDDPIPLSYEQLLDSPFDICAGDATPTGGGAWHGEEYWSEMLSKLLQDPYPFERILGHHSFSQDVGDTWTGRCVVIYCDNDAVVETIHKRKPKDPALLSLLREFLFVVVTKKFYPVVRKIGTHENELADFVSRRFDPEAAAKKFKNAGLSTMKLVKPKTRYFELSAKW